DSTLAMFALSLANHALTFQRDGSGFAAQYHVEVAFRGDSGTPRQFATDETVRVRTLQETVRADESVIYQQFIAVRPGVYHVDVTVRDRNAPAVAHGQRADTVPRLAGPRMSEPLAVYQGPGRTRLADLPTFLANPGHTPSLVSFSDQWAITNYDQMISLLRYFERQDWVDKLRQAPAEQRPVVWREFYTATDPVEATPENEALEAYFRRVQFANQRFRESGDPGWLTDRGEVYVTLGEPDDVFDFSTDVSRAGVRGIRWTYNSLRLTLFFQ